MNPTSREIVQSLNHSPLSQWLASGSSLAFFSAFSLQDPLHLLLQFHSGSFPTAPHDFPDSHGSLEEAVAQKSS
jgi:hypothetical protein